MVVALSVIYNNYGMYYDCIEMTSGKERNSCKLVLENDHYKTFCICLVSKVCVDCQIFQSLVQ